jgi:hypothetical protein
MLVVWWEFMIYSMYAQTHWLFKKKFPAAHWTGSAEHVSIYGVREKSPNQIFFGDPICAVIDLLLFLFNPRKI